MVTVTFLQLKLSSVATDMFVNVFRVGFHGRVRSHGDSDIFTTHVGVKRICLCWSRVSTLNRCQLNLVHSTTRGQNCLENP